MIPGRAKILGAGVLSSLALAGAGPSPAAAVTPVVECMSPTETAGVLHVYYGYVNPGAPATIDFGTTNQVIPGFGFQGQPTVFNTGSYARVFRAIFNAGVFSAIAWDLDGTQGIATPDTPLCASGATGPASDLTTTGATLNGLVDSVNVETTYSFEYGPTIAYGETTPERTLTSPVAELVSEPLTGLAPGTTYHYRLATDGDVATVGEDRTFTTQPAPAPPVKPKKCKKKQRKGKGKKRKCRKGKGRK